MLIKKVPKGTPCKQWKLLKSCCPANRLEFGISVVLQMCRGSDSLVPCHLGFELQRLPTLLSPYPVGSNALPAAHPNEFVSAQNQTSHRFKNARHTHTHTFHSGSLGDSDMIQLLFKFLNRSPDLTSSRFQVSCRLISWKKFSKGVTAGRPHCTMWLASPRGGKLQKEGAKHVITMQSLY